MDILTIQAHVGEQSALNLAAPGGASDAAFAFTIVAPPISAHEEWLTCIGSTAGSLSDLPANNCRNEFTQVPWLHLADWRPDGCLPRTPE
jgi:hypothetical protein